MKQRTKNSINWGKIGLCILPVVSSCNQAPEKSVSQMSQDVCECFNKQKGSDIDAKLEPCINQITTPQTATLKQGYSRKDSAAAVDAGVSKEMTKVSEVTTNLVTSCDAFGSEVEAMYDKWYPADSSATNLAAIKTLTAKFDNVTTSDTASKRVLHELIARNIKARRLEEGLRRCQQMKELCKEEGGAYFASAFAYNLQKRYSLAVSELKQEISLTHDEGLKLIIAVAKRKAQRDKVDIN